MKCKEFQGKQFYHNEADSPKAQVIILHGINEHGLRYAELSNHLKLQGITSSFIDHPGHGLNLKSGSEMTRVTDAYSSHYKSNDISNSCIHYRNTATAENFKKEFREAGKDLSIKNIVDYQLSFIKHLYKENLFSKKLPLFVFGQSLGGLISANITFRLQEENNTPCGTLFLNPAFDAIAPPAKNRTTYSKLSQSIQRSFIQAAKRACTKSTLFGTLILSVMLKINPLSDETWAADYISDIQEENNLFKIDPLIGHSSSLRFLHSILNEMITQVNKSSKFPCPFYIAYGTEDKIINSKGSEKFIAGYNTTHDKDDSHVHRLKGFQPHELHRASIKMEIFENISNWIQTCSRNNMQKQ